MERQIILDDHEDRMTEAIRLLRNRDIDIDDYSEYIDAYVSDLREELRGATI